jgi:hypothetical protein
VTSKQQLLSDLDAAYESFLQEVQGLSNDQFHHKFVDDAWGVKEIVAHLTGWHGEIGGGFERMARGERPVPEGQDWNNPDTMNEIYAERSRGKRKDQVLEELAAAVAHFKEAAAKLPDDRYGEGKTANKLFDGAGIGHFHEHAEQVREAAARGALDPHPRAE